MTRTLVVICFSNFWASAGIRLTDPVLPQIAREFAIDVQRAALLATAFALPWVIAQPVFGPLGDLIGRTRVIKVNLIVLVVATLAGAWSTSFAALFAARVVAGIATAGVMPVGFALSGDLIPARDRAAGIARVVAASMAGTLLGAVAAGLLGDLVGWRGVFVASGIGVAIATVVVIIGFRGVAENRAATVNLAAAVANYRAVFANPLAKVCYVAVFFEGIAIFGVIPYIAPLLVASGERRASIAGLVIAGFAVGGIAYSLLVPVLMPRVGARRLMIAGGVLAAIGLAVIGVTQPWPLLALGVTVLGFGFFMLHNGIQMQMLELAPQARGSAVAMHASTFFTGQAIGPVLIGLSLPAFGAPATTIAAGLVVIAVAMVSARLLYGHGSAGSGPADE